MSKLVGQWIDLFRAGNHGDKGTFTTQDLDKIVTSYDPAHHEAPVVVGHPQTDAPAYGWVSKLRRMGDLLQGQFDQVAPAFAEAVDAGRFKKRSVRLYKTADGYSLRHVGFLGAQPPEIKGLADIKFEQEDKEATEIEFSEEASVALSEAETTALSNSIWDRMKAHIPGLSKTTDPASKSFSEEDVERIAGKAVETAVAAAVKPLEERLKKQETDFSEGRKQIATAATQQRADAAIAKVKGSKAWVPAFDKMGLPLVFAELAKVEETVEFGEGDAKVKKTPLQILVDFMESGGEIVPSGRKVEGTPGAAPVSALPSNADPTSIQFSEAIKAEMGKDSNLTFEQAMDRVARATPALTRTGSSTAGQV